MTDVTCMMFSMKNIIFFMPLLGTVLIEKKFAEQFADFTGTDRIYIVDTGAFYFDISAEYVKFLFLETGVQTTSFSF